ncbi:hypothetical protein BCR34DRAFT_601470 [Clohesyomyces aquaticus]|uniref:Uncharacterized protein n=1 Tax=Clohesyomyces aquaticus TaxID=1231657 RepID=A0A1Y1ZLQ5_9PLEO|nr:hypothetical protein BCR34DRAFT_601470 [Clohesyomyces aquaticus]
MSTTSIEREHSESLAMAPPLSQPAAAAPVPLLPPGEHYNIYRNPDGSTFGFVDPGQFGLFPAALLVKVMKDLKQMWDASQLHPGGWNGHFADAQSYYVVVDQAIRPYLDPTRPKLMESPRSPLPIANLAAMWHFVRENAEVFVAKAEPAVFVPLVTPNEIDNPGFAKLHSVQYGQIGWGFDAEGRISLYRAKMMPCGGLWARGVYVLEEGDEEWYWEQIREKGVEQETKDLFGPLLEKLEAEYDDSA